MKLIDFLNEKLILSITNFKNIEVSGVFDNSENVTKNSIFVAIKGANSDGHKFINKAISNGAMVIVYEDEPNIEHDICYIETKNSRELLAYLVHFFYDFPTDKFQLIGITGTNGKTTISYLIYNLLKKFNRKVALIGTNGVKIGDENIPTSNTTPGAIELTQIFDKCRENECQYVVMEVSSHALDQFRVYQSKFKVAIFTNLTQDHLDYHKSMENYALAKKILFDSLDSYAISILNFDDEYAKLMVQNTNSKVLYYSRKNKEVNYIHNEKFDSKGIEFDLNNTLINSKLIGKFNIDNVSASFLTLKELGFPIHEIIENLRNTDGAEGRMQVVDLNGNKKAIVDYAHTPDALEKLLITSKDLTSGKIILIFGCGGDRDKSKRPIMGEIAEKYADFTIVTSDNPRTENPIEIIKDIERGINKNYVIIEDRAEAIKYGKDLITENDLLLVAGKGHEKYQIIGKDKIYFDDVNELLKN